MKRVDVGKILRKAKTRDDLVAVADFLGAPNAPKKFESDKDLGKYLKNLWDRYESDPFRGTPSFLRRMKILRQGFEQIEEMKKTLRNLERCLENGREFPFWTSELKVLAANLYGLGMAESALVQVERESAPKSRKRK